MPSYLLRNSKSGSLTTRNERDIRMFPGDTDHTIESTPDAPSNINSVIMGIIKHHACMKTPESTEKANPDADNTESSGSGRGIESKAPGIRETQPSTHWSELFQPQIC